MFTFIKEWLIRVMFRLSVNRCTSFDNIKDVIWEVDTQLRIVNINKAVEAYGWDSKDLIGKYVSSICPPETMELCFNAINKYKLDPGKYTDQSLKVICNYKDSDKTYNAEINVSVLKHRGKVIGYNGVSRNIDDQLELKDLKNKDELYKGVYNICSNLCHEAVQPMQIIYGHICIINMLDLELKEDREQLIFEVNKIESQLDRVTELMKRIQIAKSNSIRDNTLDELMALHIPHMPKLKAV